MTSTDQVGGPETQIIKFRFSILSLLIAIVVVAMVLAFWVRHVELENKIEYGSQLIGAFDAENTKNPATIIRAGNYLHGLGHANALEAMKRYSDRNAQFNPAFSGGNENIDVILPLLFEPIRPNEKLPVRVFDEPDSFKLERDEWQTHVEIHDGIPFCTNMVPISYSGPISDSTYLIEWADQHARLRDDFLVPTDDPFSTAESLIPTIIKRKLAIHADLSDEDRDEIPSWITNRIRSQVFHLVEHLVPRIENPAWVDWASEDKLWSSLKSECYRGGMKWDRSQQKYVFTK